MLSLVVATLASGSFAAASAVDASARQLLYSRSLTTSPTDLDGRSFDFVIAGGGTAGLALASRLSEWANVTVAVVEAGTDGSEFKDRIYTPGYAYLNGLTKTSYDWQYNTVPQIDANSTTKYWPRGKGLGGSSAINGAFWTRGSQEDYDAWNTLNPDSTEDWGWTAMSAYINKAETYTAPTDAQSNKLGGVVSNMAAHGSSGPIHASTPAYLYEGINNWIPTWEALGFKSIDAHAGTKRGVSITPMTIRPSNQTRSDSKAGYIDPYLRPNLVILTGFQATAVTWNSTTSGSAVAGGIKFQATKGGQTYTVSANKEVILAGGTVGSPQLLQLSGVGPKALLSSLGITVVSDLPVGYNLQDHISTSVAFSVPTGSLVWGNLLDATRQAAALTLYKSGDYSNSQLTYLNDATGYPSVSDIMADGASFASAATAALDANVAAITSYQTLPANVAAGTKLQYQITNGWLSTDSGCLEIIQSEFSGTDGVAIQVALQHPYSRGTIMINSTDAFSKPVIDPGYFGMSYDMEIMTNGIAFARKIASTAPMNTYMLSEGSPGSTVTGSKLEDFIRTSAGTEYHPLGTCSMQPQANGGVVSPQLIVYGTTNLRVIDASIMPLQISAHLMASVYGIAEKGADMIKAVHVAVPVTAPTTLAAGSSASKTSAHSSGSASASNSAGTIAGAVSGSNMFSSMSSTTRNVVIGAVLGGAALIAVGLVALCMVRKSKRAAAQDRAAATQSFYGNSAVDDAWDSGYAKEPYGSGGAGHGVQLNSLGAPAPDGLDYPPVFAGASSDPRASMASYDTAEMSGSRPLAHDSSTPVGGWYHAQSPSQPYFDSPSQTPCSLSPQQGNTYDQQHSSGYEPANLAGRGAQR